MNIGKYLLECLLSYGVEHIFGIPGDYNLKFVKEIEGHQILFINTTRENTAGYMADAYGRKKGLGACAITYGVGINIANAASQAFAESSPLVIISGAPGKGELEKSVYLHHLINPKEEEQHERTQENILKNVTVDQAILTDPFSAKRHIDRVLQNAFIHKKPVYIELPRDLVQLSIELEDSTQAVKKFDKDVLQEALAEIEALLKSAKNPVIWIGHEIQRNFLSEPLLCFAEKCTIPIVTALLGKGTISERHPLFAGVYQGRLSRSEVAAFVESSDLIMSFGVLLSDVDTGIFTAELPKNRSIVIYNEEVKIGHHRFVKVPIADIVNALGKVEWNYSFKNAYPSAADRSTDFTADKGKKLTMQRTLDCIEAHLGPEDVLVADIGDSLFGSTNMIVEKDGYLACSYFANMGFSIPGAIALKFAEPGKRVIALTGDGAFQMTCNELSTAARYKQPIIVLLLNNHGYGTERMMIDGSFNDIHNWNYALFPELVRSGKGIKVSKEDELERGLKEAISSKELFLIEIELGELDQSDTLKRLSEVVIF